MIERRIMSELPFMATEYIIMEGVTKGGDRQEFHERIRMHSMEAGKNVKVEGKDNDLIERILADDYFNIDKTRLMEILDPKNFIGFASAQTVDFIKEEVQPIIDANKELLGLEADLHV
jgi:Adenylosuccinate lyase